MCCWWINSVWLRGVRTALVLAVNTCCDLTGASFQAWRQQECLAALLASLLASSSAVLSQAASWLFPKLMQNLE